MKIFRKALFIITVFVNLLYSAWDDWFPIHILWAIFLGYPFFLSLLKIPIFNKIYKKDKDSSTTGWVFIKSNFTMYLLGLPTLFFTLCFNGLIWSFVGARKYLKPFYHKTLNHPENLGIMFQYILCAYIALLIDKYFLKKNKFELTYKTENILFLINFCIFLSASIFLLMNKY